MGYGPRCGEPRLQGEPSGGHAGWSWCRHTNVSSWCMRHARKCRNFRGDCLAHRGRCLLDERYVNTAALLESGAHHPSTSCRHLAIASMPKAMRTVSCSQDAPCLQESLPTLLELCCSSEVFHFARKDSYTAGDVNWVQGMHIQARYLAHGTLASEHLYMVNMLIAVQPRMQAAMRFSEVRCSRWQNNDFSGQAQRPHHCGLGCTRAMMTGKHT